MGGLSLSKCGPGSPTRSCPSGCHPVSSLQPCLPPPPRPVRASRPQCERHRPRSPTKPWPASSKWLFGAASSPGPSFPHLLRSFPRTTVPLPGHREGRGPPPAHTGKSCSTAWISLTPRAQRLVGNPKRLGPGLCPRSLPTDSGAWVPWKRGCGWIQEADEWQEARRGLQGGHTGGGGAWISVLCWYVAVSPLPSSFLVARNFGFGGPLCRRVKGKSRELMQKGHAPWERDAWSVSLGVRKLEPLCSGRQPPTLACGVCEATSKS